MEPFNLKHWDKNLDITIDQVVIDTRAIRSSRALFVALPGTKTDGHHFLEAASPCYALIRQDWDKTPSHIIPIKVASPLVALQEIATTYRQWLNTHIIAIAGSYGKTMLKNLLSQLCSNSVVSPESYNSQIGVPLSLLTIEKKHQVAFIEAAISQPGEMQILAKMIRPNQVIVTSLEQKYLAPEVLQKEIDILMQSCNQSPTPALPHAIFPDPTPRPTMHYQITFPDNSTFTHTTTTGYTYFLNHINLAIKTAWQLGVTKKTICDVLCNYTPQPVRTEIWKTPEGTTIIHDNFSSLEASLRKLQKHAEGRKLLLYSGNISSYKYHIDQQFDSPDTVKELKPQDTLLIKGFPNTSNFTNLCTINLATIKSNISILRKPNTRMMIMVKALAYGTNDLMIAKFLEECGIDILGVSYVEEGIALKRAKVTQDIFVVNATPQEAQKIVDWNLQIGVSNSQMIQKLQETAKNQKIKVHLHIDTGMGRFGCQPDEALTLSQQILNSPNLIFEGIMTHFAAADDPAHDAFTLNQSNIFAQIIQQIDYNIPWKHAANSSAYIRFNFSQYNMARIGLAIYGLQTVPFPGLRPAISLTSRIVGINTCCKGETISYGRTYTIDKETQRIAVIPIGYHDGLHRNYSGKAEVIIRGKRAPMIGKICMDYLMVDITHIPEAEIEDPVLIFGEDEHGHFISPESLAKKGDTIPHELITCLGPRIQRVFVDEEKAATTL